MDELKVTGKIILVDQTRSGVNSQGKQWSAVEYVLQTLDPQYPKHVVFSVFNDKITQFNLHEGSVVTIWIDIDASNKNSTGRWFSRITAYKCEQLPAYPPQAPSTNEDKRLPWEQ